MKQVFQPGAIKTFEHTVTHADTATFASGQVHPVYATFALARDAEWCCRLFVLEMKEEGEEGIGTFINVKHHAPALTGSTVVFTATVRSIEGNEIICNFEAHVGERLIANGEQGQKILRQEKLDQLFGSLK